MGQGLSRGLGGPADGEVQADGPQTYGTATDAAAAAAGEGEVEMELVAGEPADGVYGVIVGAFWSLAKRETTVSSLRDEDALDDYCVHLVKISGHLDLPCVLEAEASYSVPFPLVVTTV